MKTIRIPADAQAVALGADRVADAVARLLQEKGEPARVVRTGSRRKS